MDGKQKHYNFAKVMELFVSDNIDIEYYDRKEGEKFRGYRLLNSKLTIFLFTLLKPLGSCLFNKYNFLL